MELPYLLAKIWSRPVRCPALTNGFVTNGIAMANCLQQDTLVAFIEGRLRGKRMEDLQRHIDECSTCLEEVAMLAEHGVDTSPSENGSSSSLMPEVRDASPNTINESDLPEREQLISRPAPPTQLEEYRLLHRLGEGAMGEVYLYEDTLLHRLVAVKFISAVLRNADAYERFMIEARAIARLSHPNVLTIHRVGESQGRTFLVSEYIKGRSLAELALPMAWQEVLRIGIELSRGLAAAHRRDVLHRDLKPSNVMMNEHGEVKLLDFGLAKLMDETASVSNPNLDDCAPEDITSGWLAGSMLTRTGTIIGTPLYVAPEIWRGMPATRRSDVYSLGAVLYELCTGYPPHRGATLKELRQYVQERAAAPLLTLVATVDTRFAEVVDRCLDRDPHHRFAGGEEIRQALDAVIAKYRAIHDPTLLLSAMRKPQAEQTLVGKHSSPISAKVQPPTRNRILAYPVTGLLLLAFVTVLLYSLLTRRQGAQSIERLSEQESFRDDCKRWGDLILQHQFPDGGFSPSAYLRPGGWSTAQQLAALAWAHRACGVLTKDAIVRGDTALAATRGSHGWGDDANSKVEAPATAWALMAYTFLAQALNYSGAVVHAAETREFLLNAQLGDGGFPYLLESSAKVSDPYSTVMVLWALIEAESLIPSSNATERRQAASALLRRAFLDSGSYSARHKDAVPVAPTWGVLRVTAGFEEQAFWVLQREVALFPGARQDADVRIAFTFAEDLLRRCDWAIEDRACRRPYDNNGRLSMGDLKGPSWTLTTLWLPWMLLSTDSLLQSQLIKSTTTRQKLGRIRQWCASIIAIRSLREQADYARYVVAEYLFAISHLLRASEYSEK